MELEKYLRGQAFYYVEDCFSCEKSDVEYLFFLESPHKDEIKLENPTPLVGSSGLAVTKFLFGDSESKPFGEKVKGNETIYKIGIVNISNVPLQTIESVAKENSLPKELENIRDVKKTNDILYNVFKKKMDSYDFKKVRQIIVCGEFASLYVDEYNKEKQWNEEIILKVPHPSRGQWAFIEKHKNNLEKLRKLFSEVNEK